MTKASTVQEVTPDQGLRGQLFEELDRLAFALEMEAAELLARGEEAAAERFQQQRLGVRMAQRMVADVWAEEVHQRVRRWTDEYEARLERAPE